MSRHSGGRRRYDKRDSVEPDIVQALTAAGRQWIPWPADPRDPGRPDGMAVWGGGFCILELKSEEGRLSPEQKAWHQRYRGPRGTLAIVRTPLQALRATGVPGRI